MSIRDFYHKNDKKSRSFDADHPQGRWINILLVISIIIVLVLIVVNRTYNKVNKPEKPIAVTNITISPQSEVFFGKDTMDVLIQEFEDANPGLRIQVAEREEADIIFFDESELDQPGQWTVQKIMTMVSFVDLFFYNIDILKEADCDRPPKTRAEFLATARAVAKRYPPSENLVYAFALGLDDPIALRRDFYPWVWADGGEVYPSGATTLSRTATNAISFLGQFESEGLLAPQSFDKTGSHRLEEFASGKIAMMIASAQNIVYLRSNAPDIKFDITTIPASLQGKSRLGLSGIYVGINSNSSQPDEAMTFLGFILGKGLFLAETLGAVPGSFSSSFPNEYIINDALYSKAWDIYEAADIVERYKILEEEIREKLSEVIKR